MSDIKKEVTRALVVCAKRNLSASRSNNPEHDRRWRDMTIKDGEQALLRSFGPFTSDIAKECDVSVSKARYWLRKSDTLESTNRPGGMTRWWPKEFDAIGAISDERGE